MTTLEFTDSELKLLYDCIKGTKLVYKLPEELLDVYFYLKYRTIKFNPLADSIKFGEEIDIPLTILFEIDEVLNAWGVVVKAVQALECQNYVANRFFSFPSFILKDGIIKLDKEIFVLHKGDEQQRLFTIVEIKDLVRDVKKALHSTAR